MVASEYSTDEYKPSKTNFAAIIKNLEMINFIPDHLKTNKMCKHAVKNCLL